MGDVSMKRSATLLLEDRETVRLYSDLTISAIRSLRESGAVILHLEQTLTPEGVHRAWVTDSGKQVAISFEFRRQSHGKHLHVHDQ